jgi:hypothetical protein
VLEAPVELILVDRVVEEVQPLEAEARASQSPIGRCE